MSGQIIKSENVKQYNGKTLTWDNKPFYIATYWEILGIPINLKSVIERAQREIHKHRIQSDEDLVLSRDEAMFHSSLLIPVKGYTDKLPIETLSGQYHVQVYEGGAGEVKKLQKKLSLEIIFMLLFYIKVD